MEKLFQIVNLDAKNQYIRTYGLGRIMFRPEADEIVGRYGSHIQRDASNTSFNIIPPIAKDKLPELGAALVELAKTLDPSATLPKVDIN